MNGSKRTKQVRLLTDRDAEAYWHLRMNSINESPELACPGVVRELALHARGWRNVPSIHAMEGGCIWGGHDAGALVGVVAVSRYLMREGAEFQLWGLYVDAGYRESHVAATLVCSARSEEHTSELQSIM